jgi:hypothetical protein
MSTTTKPPSGRESDASLNDKGFRGVIGKNNLVMRKATNGSCEFGYDRHIFKKCTVIQSIYVVIFSCNASRRQLSHRFRLEPVRKEAFKYRRELILRCKCKLTVITGC